MKSIKISDNAYIYLVNKVENDPATYKSRGITGVIDDILFNRFTTSGRGGVRKKTQEKRIDAKFYF